MQHANPGTLAAVFAALYAAHMVADHWVQTQHQADVKGRPGLAAMLACGRHVATYTATAFVFLAVMIWRCGLHVDARQLAAGLTISAVTHYIADRRWPLHWLATRIGSDTFWSLGAVRADHPGDRPCLGTGAYALDQSWHIGFLFVAALVIA